MVQFLTFIFGAIIGSFINVVVHRLPIILDREWQLALSDDLQQLSQNKALQERVRTAAKTVAYAFAAKGQPLRYNLALPGSQCPTCGHELHAWENIPLISYILLKGRCHSCKRHISLRYPAMEFTAGVIALLNLIAFGPTPQAIAGFAFCATLLGAATIDAETMLLPDSMTLPLLWAGLGFSYWQLPWFTRSSLMAAAAAYAMLWLCSSIVRTVKKVDSMGGSDLKLAAAIGAWIGLDEIPLMFAIAVGATLMCFAVQYFRRRSVGRIPFGPGLALAGAVIWLLKPAI